MTTLVRGYRVGIINEPLIIMLPSISQRPDAPRPAANAPLTNESTLAKTRAKANAPKTLDPVGRRPQMDGLTPLRQANPTQQPQGRPPLRQAALPLRPLPQLSQATPANGLAITPRIKPSSSLLSSALRRFTNDKPLQAVQNQMDERALDLSWARFQAGNDRDTGNVMLHELRNMDSVRSLTSGSLRGKAQQYADQVAGSRIHYFFHDEGNGNLSGGKFLSKGTTFNEDIYRTREANFYCIPKNTKTLGQTNFSVVQVGEKLAANGAGKQTVAAKQYTLRLDESDREIAMMRRLPETPHFSRTREVVRTEGSATLFMDYAELGDADRLQQRIRSSNRLTPAEKQQVQRTLARHYLEAVNEMHSHETPVFHQDIHPKNFLVAADGRVMLADFGAASAHEHGGIDNGRARMEVPGAEINGRVNPNLSKRDGDRYMLAKTLESIAPDDRALQHIASQLGSPDRPLAAILAHPSLQQSLPANQFAELLQKL